MTKFQRNYSKKEGNWKRIDNHLIQPIIGNVDTFNFNENLLLDKKIKNNLIKLDETKQFREMINDALEKGDT